jgi:hypothetical protein
MSSLFRLCVFLLLPTFICLAVQPPMLASKSIQISSELLLASTISAEECNDGNQGGNFSHFDDIDCITKETRSAFDLMASEPKGGSHLPITNLYLLETCFQPPECTI